MRADTNQSEKSETKLAASFDFKTLPLSELEKKLGWSPDGLTRVEAQKRLAQYGPNEIADKEINPLPLRMTTFVTRISQRLGTCAWFSGSLRSSASSEWSPAFACSISANASFTSTGRIFRR
jgi:hypothetical protein